MTTVAAIVLYTVPNAIGGILEDLDSLHLYQEELGHVCQTRNVESGPRAADRGTEKAPDNAENFGSVPHTSPFIDITAFAVVNEPLRGVGAAAAALLVAAEAHRNAGLASHNVAVELERLLDRLAGAGDRRA